MRPPTPTLTDPATYEVAPAESWRRLKLRVKNRKGLAVLMELAAWRERAAQDQNVPRSRIQHTDVSQGPVQRRYGIATLRVHTAGTENASVELGGLEHGVARLVREFLLGRLHAHLVKCVHKLRHRARRRQRSSKLVQLRQEVGFDFRSSLQNQTGLREQVGDRPEIADDE